MKLRALVMLLICCLPIPAEANQEWQRRWVYISQNLYVDANLDKIEAILDRAKAAGFNGILFTDYKTSFWWELEAADRWERNAHRLRTMTRERDLDLALSVFPYGYAGSLLYHDPNLASGIPIRDAPLIAKNGQLLPADEAAIPNGSFEASRKFQITNCQFQDGAGRFSFPDSETSLRFDLTKAGAAKSNARICFRIPVRPWQQYRLSVRTKRNGVRGGETKLIAIGRNDSRLLQFEHLHHRDATTDWVEETVAFNSLTNQSVNVYAGTWSPREGTIWWDDLRIEPVPTLNLLRRESLPVTIRGENGQVFAEGRDFARIEDPGLGRHPWAGEFDTRHEPPVIRLTPDSRIHGRVSACFSARFTRRSSTAAR